MFVAVPERLVLVVIAPSPHTRWVNCSESATAPIQLPDSHFAANRGKRSDLRKGAVQDDKIVWTERVVENGISPGEATFAGWMRRRVLTACTMTIIVVLAYLFRFERSTSPDFGDVTYVWRWGIASHMNADTNRDGDVDLVISWNEGRAFVTSFPARELRADRDFDGRYHLRITYYPRALVEIDQDADGWFETTYRGEQAQHFLSHFRVGRRVMK